MKNAVNPSQNVVNSSTLLPLCAVPSKSYDFSTNYHACIAIPTWCSCAPPILFWPPFNLLLSPVQGMNRIHVCVSIRPEYVWYFVCTTRPKPLHIFAHTCTIIKKPDLICDPGQGHKKLCFPAYFIQDGWYFVCTTQPKLLHIFAHTWCQSIVKSL